MANYKPIVYVPGSGGGIKVMPSNNLLECNGFVATPNNLASAASISIDLSQKSKFALAIAHNVTFTFTNPVPGGGCSILIVQTTGGNTATFNGCKFFGSTPTLSTAAGAIDLFGAEVFTNPVDGTTVWILANLLKGAT